jgi:hypothetical protein
MIDLVINAPFDAAITMTRRKLPACAHPGSGWQF